LGWLCRLLRFLLRGLRFLLGWSNFYGGRCWGFFDWGNFLRLFFLIIIKLSFFSFLIIIFFIDG
jgi:hypothetical protein